MPYMKYLLLIRHAKSSWDSPTLKDHDRPLNERGNKEAPMMAQRLLDQKILIDSFKDLLPEAVWNRPKMGFSFPLQQWMQQHADISNETLYNNKTAKSIIAQFKNGEVHWSKAFMLYQLNKYE